MLALLFSFLFLFQSLDIKPLEPKIKQYNGLNFEYFDLGSGGRNSLQDSRGLLWLGTNNQVLVYNGYELISYQRDLSSNDGIQGSVFSALVEDDFGRVWAANHSGYINVFDNGIDKNLTKIRPDLYSPEAPYYEAGKDLNGDLWISQPNQIIQIKVFESLDSTKEIYHSFDEELFGRFEDLYVTKNGKILVNGKKLYELVVRDTGGSILIETDINNEDPIKDITEDPDGNLIVITNRFIYLISDEGLKKFEVNLTQGNINSVIRDNNGAIWAATDSGVYRLILDENHNLVKTMRYELGFILEAYLDRSGNLFFLAGNGRLYKLSAEYLEFQFVPLPNGYEENYVHNFVVDQNGRFWVGGEGGTYVYNPETEEFLTANSVSSILNSERVYSMIKDLNGNIWVGTRYELIKYDPVNMKSWAFNYKDKYIEEMPYDNRVFHDFRLAPDGMIWGSSTDKLFKLNPSTNEVSYYFEYEDEELKIGKLIVDDTNLLWAWNKNGIDIFDVNEGVFERLDNGIASKAEVWNPNYMTIDNLGRIWVSFQEGILVIDREKREIIKHLNKNTGLPGNFAWEIIKDNKGLMWVKQARYGSFAIDPETFKVVDQTRSWTFNPDREMYNGINAIAEDGKMFADGWGGFYHFYLDETLESKVTPNILLQEVAISDSIQLTVWNNLETKEYRLNHSENDLKFSTVAVQFDDPAQNEYSYYMEDYDNGWTEPSTQRVHEYLNLDPGSYTFYVKASNADGVWTEPVQLATIVISPPFWANLWAYSLYLFLISFITFRFYKAQLNKRVAETETERLKEVDEFKSRFFTNITHEFRTPLTVISGLANRISDDSGVVIKRNAQKLLGLINQILELSKLEANNGNLKLSQGDIVAYINYLCQSYSSFAEENKINLLVESDDNQIFMDFDKDKIDLIIQNIVSNAIKFTDQGGSIHIFISRNSRQLTIEVSDTGRGISEDELPKIFDRFYQVETAYSNHQGSGIGLSLTRELVRLMDGNISVSSILGKGTSFIIKLPITQNEEVDTTHFSQFNNVISDKEALSNDEDIIDEISDKNLVLLIEDNEDVRDFIYSVIQKDFDVITARDGKEGIELALDKIPDMIVSDVMMPEKNGIEVTQILKSDTKTSHIPIILLTAKADIESKLEGLKTGADIYLAKPFNESELILHLNNLLAQRERIRAKYNATEEVEKTEDEFIVKIRELLMEQLDDEDFGINEICHQIGASRTQLHRKLKALTGKSSSIFIRDIRLKEAQELLQTTSSSISEVAYQVGFGDPNYFSKLYSEKYSYSPSKERE